MTDSDSTNVLIVNHLTRTHLKRIFSKIVIRAEVSWNGTPCWVWCAYKQHGYGRMAFEQRAEYVHRLLWAWLVHPLPRGKGDKELDHLCRNPSCCNPIHLDFIPPRLNVLRGISPPAINAKRTHCIRGHAFTPENTRIKTDGNRGCLTCINAYNANWRSRYPWHL